MSSRIHDDQRDFLLECIERLGVDTAHWCSCRQCGTRCDLMSDVCPVCGTQDPVRWPMTWVFFAGAICCTALALVVWLA